jgi:hypothetical protein
MNEATEKGALAAVDTAVAGNLANAAHTSTAETLKLPTPSEVAKMTDEAFYACEVASSHLRKLGNLAEQMAATIQQRCTAAADLFLKTATMTNDSIKQFSNIMHTLGGTVAEVTENLEKSVQPAPPPAASVPDQFGKKAAAKKAANGE